VREPNFENLLKVLRREEPDRPTLFEFFLNPRLHARLAGDPAPEPGESLAGFKHVMRAFRNAGYDYVTMLPGTLHFPSGEQQHAKSVSQNEGAVITDRASFEAYDWPDPDRCDYSRLDSLAPELPDGMKFICQGPRGVLENAISLVGYEALCIMIHEDPELAGDVFDAIGSRLVRHYEITAAHEAVGALIGNDDWGFRTQTLFRPETMRRYVFRWHKRIVQAIHAAGKPAILHSCGNLSQVMDDVVDDIRYDAKHSFEDAIEPVEEAYERHGEKIAILGGIDVDFLCRATAEEIKARARAMLERSAGRGGYALGSGNSIPDYVPDEAYLAMISVVS
jgi:uroporphyrinogen decarboxylase